MEFKGPGGTIIRYDPYFFDYEVCIISPGGKAELRVPGQDLAKWMAEMWSDHEEYLRTLMPQIEPVVADEELAELDGNND